jgi:hypothetical protein
MKVICTGNSGENLPPRYLGHGYSRATAFDLVIGTEYTVYSICLHQGSLAYLLAGEGPGRRPEWYPAELFQVTNGELPSIWQYAFYGFESQLNAIWGYDELVNVPEYFDDLSNLEESAELIFWKRQQEIDNLYTSQE